MLVTIEKHCLLTYVIHRTHLGTLECRLCLTLHVNEGSYLAHTQGKKHQTNLARRAAKDNKDQALMIQAPTAAQQVKKKVFVKIGRPGKSVPTSHLALISLIPALGYKIIKIREPVSQRMGLLFTVSLPEIKAGERPRRRFMSAFEQRREIPNKAFQYLVVSYIQLNIYCALLTYTS